MGAALVSFHIYDGDPECVVPSQFYPRQDLAPEEKLLLAVLIDGIATVKNGPGNYNETRAAYREARHWMSLSDKGYFGFEGICQHLNLTCGAIRRWALSPDKPRKRLKRLQLEREAEVGRRRARAARRA